MTDRLRVANLEVRYGDLVGVADVSFEVAEGSVVALLGSNGAGKTTTLNAIAGLVKPSRGTIEWRGEDIGRLPAMNQIARSDGHLSIGALVRHVDVEHDLELAKQMLTDSSGDDRDFAIRSHLHAGRRHDVAEQTRSLDLAGARQRPQRERDRRRQSRRAAPPPVFRAAPFRRRSSRSDSRGP